jgi:transcriptional regulator with XRE-family HTH domain
MDSLSELRKLFSITQSEMAEFIGIKRSKYSMIELQKRNADLIKLSGLDQLLNYYNKARIAPDNEIVESLSKSINNVLIAELINHSTKLQDEIEEEEQKLDEMNAMHQRVVFAFIVLKMLENDGHNRLSANQQDWITLQLRLSKKRMTSCSAFQIQLKRIHIIGLYTQLDQIKLLLQSA